MQENRTLTGEIPQSAKNTALKGPSPFVFYISILAFIGVIILSGVLYFLTSTTQSQIQSIQEETASSVQQLKTVKKNETLFIADAIQKKLIKPSIDIKWVVNMFLTSSRLAQVRFQGFSIKDDIISTNLIASHVPAGSTHTDPVLAIIKMMNDYQKEDSRLFFSLESISSIGWNATERTTPIQLKIRPTQDS